VDPQPPPRRQRWIELGIVAVFLALFALFVISHSRSASPTHDETWHLAAGYSYWLWNDYRMSPDHPPFLRKLAALPLLWMNVWPSPADLARNNPSTCLRLLVSAWQQGLVRPEGCWGVNQLMFYSVRDETLHRFGVNSPFAIPTTAHVERSEYFNDTDRIVFWARIPVLLLGLLLALLVYAWARESYGFAGGALALAFCCFDPNIIAHSSLVTADIGTTVFMFGAVYCFWRTCRQLTWLNVLLTGLCVGLAIISKSSAVLLLPIFAALAVVRIASNEPWPAPAMPWRPPVKPWSRTAALAGIGLLVALVAYFAMWTAYGFRYSAAYDPVAAAKLDELVPATSHVPHEPGHFPIEYGVRKTAAIRHLTSHHTAEELKAGFTPEQFDEAMRTAPLGLTGRLVLFAQRHRLLPEAFLYGFAQIPQAAYRTSFLRGEYSRNGFRSYFGWTFLLKTPLVTLAGIVVALALVLRRREAWPRWAFLLLPVTIFFAVCVVSRLNIGHRHLLPIYPFLFVLCGSLAVPWAQWKPATRRWTAICAFATIAINSLVVFAPPWRPAVVYPHYLAYFNELAGGPRNGHKHLVDSNLDWGQDLKGVKRWLDKNGVTEPINLCYFGVSDARYYQVPHLNLPGTFDTAPSVPFEQARVPGYVVISATHLQGAYFSEEGRAAWRKFLGNARLVHTIGYSIFIYRLDRAP